MSDLDLDALEAKAKAATPGPWQSDRNCVYVEPGAVRWWIANTNTIRGASGYYASPIAEAETKAGIAPTDNEDEDAAFIAACSPDTILALIARVRRAEAK